ncbi:MAG TPA: HPP family protein [Thermomicrobiales bacterium]|nr:HPP family protein [Thermomicrobiales bacterium]
MGKEPDAIELLEGGSRVGRPRLPLPDELTLAILPTLTVLLVLWTGDVFANRHVLFAALASSAFLIYMDPMHGTNRLPVLILSHLLGAVAGMGAVWWLGYSAAAAGLAVGVTIAIMVGANIMHPPAIGTSLSFAFHSGLDDHITLFLLALGMVVILGVLQRITQYLLVRLTLRHRPASEDARRER